MYDVVFITPNTDGEIASEAMGTLLLSNILEQDGISCRVLPFFQIGDLDNFSQFIQHAVDLLSEMQPKIVSFYTRCDVYHIDLKLAEIIKAKWKDICVVCGGPQSDITATETMQQIPYVDYICCGEGESTISPFFRSILQGSPDLTIPGVVYRADGRIVKNPRPELLKDLDALPMPDYSTLKSSGYKHSERKHFPIEIGRGCPFGCSFCTTNSFWGRHFRLKSPERIYLEIKNAHKQFGCTKFKFTHDMFTLNRSKVIETCGYLRKLDFPVTWAGSSRLDCIDRELIDIMADSGMTGLYFGVETGSPRMQKIIHKNLKLENAVDIIGYMASKKLKSKVSFIYGFPEETEEDISETIALIAQLLCIKKVSVDTHLCTFLVGTELSEKYQSEMEPVDFYSNITGTFAVEECKDIILQNPNIFMHMLEYRTELRTRLKHFELFIRVWQLMQPVYQYISEKYPRNRLIDMYYDFVDANREILDRIEDVPYARQDQTLLKSDRFPLRFSDDENYDKMADYCKFRRLENSEAARNGQGYSEVFCIDPSKCSKKPVQEWTRCFAVVTRQQNQLSVTSCPIEG